MSRELDAQVAEKVMGIANVYENVRGELSYGKDGIRCHLPHYSTDIAVAWQVVEKMRMMWGEVALRTNGYRWEFGWEGDGGIWGRATADTAPEAICRAALKAKEAEHD